MVKAFTILEMIINMAIMGIIIAMVYMIYVLFSSNVGGYTHFSAQYNSVQSFRNQLQNEFLESDRVLMRPDGGFTIVFYDEVKIEYFKKKQWLYRQKDRLQDSIPLKRLDVMLLPETPEGEKIVKEISITTSLQGRQVSILASKQYFSNYIQESR